jgi:hypothetical protein
VYALRPAGSCSLRASLEKMEGACFKCAVSTLEP